MEINGIPFKCCLFFLTLSLKLMQELLETFKLWHFSDRLTLESMEDFKPLNTIFVWYVRHILFKVLSSSFVKLAEKDPHCSEKSLILEHPLTQVFSERRSSLITMTSLTIIFQLTNLEGGYAKAGWGYDSKLLLSLSAKENLGQGTPTQEFLLLPTEGRLRCQFKLLYHRHG